MLQKTDFYIDGKWVPPHVKNDFLVVNPSSEEAFAMISLGTKRDLDDAVLAAKNAFETWSTTNLDERLSVIKKLLTIYEDRSQDMAEAISMEMGAPIKLSLNAQTAAGAGHIKAFIKALESFKFEHPLREDTPDEFIIREPIGVCGLITPWNWPMNQVTLKVVPAVAVGCSVVLKPSEIAPMSSLLFAEMMHDAGFPNGVFNLVNGDGPTVGEAMSSHPDIDMVSFTGSTRAGVAVTKGAADSVKRVSLELGGKGANIIFSDCDVEKAVKRGALHCFNNTGQSCNAPTRMLVQRDVYESAVEIAKKTAENTEVNESNLMGNHIGPLVSEVQYNKVQGLIDTGIKEGARLIAGGLGRPEGFNKGYFVRPTVFADVNNCLLYTSPSPRDNR